jgi:hypothetical protein
MVDIHLLNQSKEVSSFNSMREDGGQPGRPGAPPRAWKLGSYPVTSKLCGPPAASS